MTPIPAIETFLSDPESPVWSSHTLTLALDQLPGTASERLHAAFMRFDDAVTPSTPDLTSDLVHFIRDLTLYGYATKALPIADCSVLDWLLRRFHKLQLPHRAMLLALSLDIACLDPDDRSAITSLIRGTPGERLLDPDCSTHNRG